MIISKKKSLINSLCAIIFFRAATVAHFLRCYVCVDFFLTKLRYTISLFYLFFIFKTAHAQGDFFNEIQNQNSEPIRAPGVERVGAIPLPSDNFAQMPVSQIAQSQGNLEFKDNRKLNYNSTYLTGRSIYLNGENISSIRDQELDNVNLKIDNNGNIFIEAQQYEVGTEQSYHPLLPKELPKFQKEKHFEQKNIPAGVYSKETGKVTVEQKTNTENGLSPVIKNTQKEIDNKAVINQSAMDNDGSSKDKNDSSQTTMSK
jgi:hypothetical protein